MEQLITDRNAEDLAYLKRLLTVGYGGMTSDEKAWFAQNIKKGSYGASDLNRVVAAMTETNGKFKESGTVLDVNSVKKDPIKFVTVTNILGEIGNFNPGVVVSNGESYVSFSSTHRKYGKKSLLIKGDTSNVERTYTLRHKETGPVMVYLDPTHIYYVRVYVYQNQDSGSVDIYWPVAEPPVFRGKKGKLKKWTALSERTTRGTFQAGKYNFRLDYNNETVAGSMWFDGLMLIDLTADFGTGNEPSKSWCDKNIIFTESTIPATLSAETEHTWTDSDVPTKSEMAAYLAWAQSIKNEMASSTELPQKMAGLDLEGANNIEKVLSEVSEYFERMESSKMYAGEVISGE